MAGRKKAVVLQHMNQAPGSDGKIKVTCGLCGELLSHGKQLQNSKYADHIVCNCKKASKEQRNLVSSGHSTAKIKARKLADAAAATAAAAESKESNPAVSPQLQEAAATAANIAGELGGSKKGKRQAQLDSYCDKCDPARAKIILMAIVQFICGCGLAFNIVNSVFFIGMIVSLNTVFAAKYLVKSQAFQRTWLPQLYGDVHLQVASYFANYPGFLRTLGLDGYTTPASQHVVNYVETMGDKTAFRDTIEAGDKKEDAVYLAKETETQLRAEAKEMDKPVEEVRRALIARVLSHLPARSRALSNTSCALASRSGVLRRRGRQRYLQPQRVQTSAGDLHHSVLYRLHCAHA